MRYLWRVNQLPISPKMSPEIIDTIIDRSLESRRPRGVATRHPGIECKKALFSPNLARRREKESSLLCSQASHQAEDRRFQLQRLDTRCRGIGSVERKLWLLGAAKR